MNEYKFDNVLFETSIMADKALSDMRDILDRRGFVTVANLYEMADITEQCDEDRYYGWVSLRDVKITRDLSNSHQDWWTLSLPDPVSLNNKNADNNYECDDKMVSHPPHYQSKTGLEAIDVIEAFTADLTGIEATDTGNIIKYICRWKKKNGLQDLKKIQWYLTHLINHVEKTEKDALVINVADMHPSMIFEGNEKYFGKGE